ncbi:MAG TPA: hypothetical protein RMG45_00495, partial [Polyangiaceae bacterium LLY-WYZ-15_(1-7)]|nr:hypothetical protein [Polyangiaceae bacterium LLY-WYZ-15_(1-7)]
MKRATITLFLLLAAACGDDDSRRSGDAGLSPDGAAAPGDYDGDGILDEDEGRSEGTDTDGDGTPDFL